jgi:hypothetical protein
MSEAGSYQGSYQLGGWRPDRTAELSATGSDADALLVNGLRGVLAAARGDTPVGGGEATAAAPIRGQGADLGSVFADLAADLLAQLDANGLGLDDVRLDGVLATDDGGFTAWGYATGAAADNPPPVGLSLEGDPRVTGDEGGYELRCALRRG